MAGKGARPSFSVGDFVLVVVDHQKEIPKLMPRWTGPYRITRRVNEWVYEVQHLVTEILSEIHCSRLEFYFDDKLNMEIHLLEQIQHDERAAISAANRIAGSQRRNLGAT